MRAFFLALFLSLGTSIVWGESPEEGPVSASNYASLQQAIDANPGRAIYLQAQDHSLTEKIRIRKSGTRLIGPGRLIQTNAQQPVVEIESAESVELTDITLMRSDAKESEQDGLLAIRCSELSLNRIRILDNYSRGAGIALRECHHATISNCVIKDYMRTSIDDRTSSKDWGYAFRCTDGTGISVSYSTHIRIESNRIVETRLVPTPEIKEKFELGKFVKKNPTKGEIVNAKVWNEEYTDNWQQGSAIVVTAPKVSKHIQILGNVIENAAQGIDIHCDHVIIAHNIVDNSFIGMKAMHGSKHVLINANQFSRNSLWAIGLMPGAGADAENRDGGSIVSNNIISEFGFGDAHWIWGNERSPIRFDNGQQADDPPLADVLVQGNMVFAEGTPRYRSTVIIPQSKNAPTNIQFHNNLFHPGTQGIGIP